MLLLLLLMGGPMMVLLATPVALLVRGTARGLFRGSGCIVRRRKMPRWAPLLLLLLLIPRRLLLVVAVGNRPRLDSHVRIIVLLLLRCHMAVGGREVGCDWGGWAVWRGLAMATSRWGRYSAA